MSGTITGDITSTWEASIADLPAPVRDGFLSRCALVDIHSQGADLELLLAAPSQMARRMVESCSAEITEKLSASLGRRCGLTFMVDPERCPTPPPQGALVTEAAEMEVEAARDAGEIAYYARIMAQVGLPYKSQAGTEFVRVNGNLTVSFTAPSAVGLPYGMIPRLLLCWLSTEAVTSKSRELALGHTLSEFLDQLQLGRRGGAQGDITRLRKQMTSLFGSTVTAIYSLPGETGIRPIPVAEEVFLWWDPLRPAAPVFWNSKILLSEPFFRAVVERPIPVSLPVLQKLRQAPMALDLYVWLSHRLFYLKAPTTIPVELLQAQFGGAATASLRQFRAQLKENLARVTTAWPDLKAGVSREGLHLRPSPLLIHRGQR